MVTLAPNLTEIVFAAGAGDRLVAVGTADDYPPAVDTIPRFSTLPLSVESVAAHRPDLVLAADQVNSPQDVEALRSLGLPVAVLTFEGVEDVVEAISSIGRLLGSAEEAEAAAADLSARYQRLKELTGGAGRRPLVLFLVGDQPLFAFGQGSYMQDVIRAAGGRSATATVETPAPILSEEFVLMRQPEIIIGAWGEDYEVDRLGKLHPTWDVVPALRNDRVYSLDPDLFLRPGPRLVDGAWRMAAVLHPDLVERRREAPQL